METELTRSSAPRGAATRKIRDLPGPRGLPVLGNLLQIDSTRLHTATEAWSRTYGEYFRFRVVEREFLVVANAETTAAVLRDRPEGFWRTPRFEATAKELGFGGVLSSNGAAWRRQRTMVMAGFDPGHIKTYFPALVRVTDRFARRWQRAADARTQIELQPDLMRYTVDVTTGLAFGADINTLESEEDVIQSHLDKVFPALFKRLLAPVQYWHWFKLPADRRLDRHIEALRGEVAGFIAAARERMARDPSLRERPANLIEAMLAARDTPDSGLTDTEVSENVLTMLLAGEDTTANTLAWMIWLLHRNPKALERARAEVRAALGGERVPTRYEQLAALPYVEACAHETLRLKPVVPIIINLAARDTVVADIEVPAGTLVMCLMRPPATHEKHFERPGEFDPARWLAEGAPSRAAASAKRVAMPFGAGPRLCPGRYLAMLEIKMVAAMLLGGFDIEEVGVPGGAEPREYLALTMAPVGLRMRLKQRN
jgi:cytochrome P450